MDAAAAEAGVVPSEERTCTPSISVCSLSPIDMSSLHSLSPGGSSVPAPPPPSPMFFSSNLESSCGPPEPSTSRPSLHPNIAFSSNSDKILKLGDSIIGSHDKSPIRRFFIPPTLEKKHSSGDLHSRLKTRKILGVGEMDNGDIHRSKISQVLGHNEHLYLKLPRGYWIWQSFLAGFLGIQAGFLILFPSWSVAAGIVGIPPPPTTPESEHQQPHVLNTCAGQYYGAALVALAFLLWKFLHVNDKMIIRATQFATLVHYTTVCCIDVLSIFSYGLSAIFEKLVLLMFGLRLLVCVICYMYLSRLGKPSSGLRRSPSYKDNHTLLMTANNDNFPNNSTAGNNRGGANNKDK